MKQLVITKDNLENYIEELLDKIIVVENNKKENEVELKIILAGNKIITYGSATKLRQFSQLRGNKVADYKKLPLCHSHAQGSICIIQIIYTKLQLIVLLDMKVISKYKKTL